MHFVYNCETLKTRVKLNLNFTRPHAITYTNSSGRMRCSSLWWLSQCYLILENMILGFDFLGFQAIKRFPTENRIFLHVMQSTITKNSFLLVFYSYVLVFYPYVTGMYLVCCSYVLVWCFSHDSKRVRLTGKTCTFDRQNICTLTTICKLPLTVHSKQRFKKL